jgi:L-asparaginase II
MTAPPAGVPLVEVVRSGLVESVHHGRIVLLAATGETLRAWGDVDAPLFPRSSNKPLQAVGMVRLGLDVPAPQLALAAASHSGEPMHLDTAEAILAAGGLTEDDLLCPPDWPLGDAAREQWLARGASKRRLAMNCSGKHAAMLRTCQAQGWPIDDYPAAHHPLQRALRSEVAALAGEPVTQVGVDGCGAPVFALSLRGLALAFWRLARATEGPSREVADAMRRHPALVAGTDRLTTALMKGLPGLIAKDGAEGVYAAALPDGRAVAVKIDDGAARAAERAVVAGLRRLGAEGAVLDEWVEQPVLGGGRPVGAVRATDW